MDNQSFTPESQEEVLQKERETISRVVLIVFLFVLVCLVVPSLVGENKGILSVRWYGYFVILAGISALIAGRVVRHHFRRTLPNPRHLHSPMLSPDTDQAEVDSRGNRDSTIFKPVPDDFESIAGPAVA